jgi:hypothetical protein
MNYQVAVGLGLVVFLCLPAIIQSGRSYLEQRRFEEEMNEFERCYFKEDE